MYKVVYKNSIIIDIIKSPQYVRWIKRAKKFVKTDITSANGVRSSDCRNVYHVIGMPDFDGMENHKSVELIKIDKTEYDYLQSLITTEDGKTTIEVDLGPIKASKTAEVSAISEKVIHAGTDITLTDGKTYHFSFSDQDQFQIGFLATAAKNAATLEAIGYPLQDAEQPYPWHADGGDCIFYSRQDMITIGTAMQNYITYHNSYFHALRNYIYALKDPLAIADVYYGMEVPEMYWGEVYSYANL